MTSAQDLTEEVFDYVMLEKPFPKDTNIPKETLDKMKKASPLPSEERSIKNVRRTLT